MAIHVGDMQIVMQPMLNGHPIVAATEQVLNLNTSLRSDSQPAALTEADTQGNEMVSVGQTIALMVAALQSLEAQADAQQAEIEALKAEAKSKKTGKGYLQGINSMKNEEVKMKNKRYDLQGRKVTHPKKREIYIQNGRKIRK